jgi:hypothetical protein
MIGLVKVVAFCGEKIPECSAGFFCNSCRAMISSKRIVWKKA